jgi:acyl-CoA synthetase (AMP-forming)/AMP-acid ligase II
MNPVRLAEAIARFGPIFAQYYGQSEAPMVITYLAKGDHDEKRLTSCGRPTLFARTALLDTDGNPVPQGEIGEICVSGPLLSGGYWNLPEATAEAFRDGWLHTGDMAREDEDGFWYIVDRVKDMIVTGGFNVFPREVEDVVAEHPAVAQVCVIGTPDDKWGEAVTAVIVPKAGHVLTEEAVIAFCQGRLARFKIPKTVILTDALPKNPSGKLLKRELYSQKLARIHFWMMAIGFLGFWSVLTAAGLVQGAAKVYEIPYIQSVAATHPYMVGRVIFGAMIIFSQPIFLYNMYMTAKYGKKLGSKTQEDTTVPVLAA